MRAAFEAPPRSRHQGVSDRTVAARKNVLPNGERLLRDINELAAFGALPEGGIYRPAFSAALKEASDWLVLKMRAAGMTTRIDPAGTIIGRIGPTNVPAVVCGSHIDTVRGGGALDGALGVIAGLECARVLGSSGRFESIALEVVAFSDEEGAFVGLLGSRAMVGDLDAEVLAGPRGKALATAMAAAQFDFSRLGEARRDMSEIAAYLELHIEQGPVLEHRGLSVGVVDAIVGSNLVRYHLLGEARHAGSTPMSVRRDAGRGACRAVSQAFEKMAASDLAEAGRMTFGAIELRPGATNVVPAEAIVASEVRAADSAGLGRLRAIVDKAFETAATENGLECLNEVGEVDTPARLAENVMAVIRKAAEQAGIGNIVMSSGACHDAQTFASRVPTGMIFVASRNGISHHRDEFSKPTDIIAGTTVLLGALRSLLASGYQSRYRVASKPFER